MWRGKGVWDGLAAVFKSWLRRHITDGELNLRTPHEVFTKLKEHFNSQGWVESHTKVWVALVTTPRCATAADYGVLQAKITQVNIFYVDTADVERPLANSLDSEAVISHNRGIRGLFSFEAAAGGADGVLGSRVFSCWCAVCCACTSDVSGAVAECNAMEGWDQQRLRITTDRGIQAQREAAQKVAADCTKALTPGCYAVMATMEEEESSGGAMRGCRWFLVQAQAWAGGTMTKPALKRGSCKSMCVKNEQVVRAKDPLIRVTYFVEDADDADGAFNSTIAVTDASALGLRYVLAGDEYEEKEGEAVVLTAAAVDAISSALQVQVS